MAEQGVEITVLRLMELSNASLEALAAGMPLASRVLILEEICAGSGIREAMAWAIHKEHPDITVEGIDLGHRFVPHGDVNTLYQHFGLDAQSICDYILGVVHNEN